LLRYSIDRSLGLYHSVAPLLGAACPERKIFGYLENYSLVFLVNWDKKRVVEKARKLSFSTIIKE
jgi:hypothetical protein